MNLYIEVENGQVKNHPAFEENLIQAFGVVPEHWEPFNRLEVPVLSMYQVFEDPQVTYEKVNGVWTDVFHIRNMTAEEQTNAKQMVIQSAQAAWITRDQAENWSAWVLNEETFVYEPPIPRPTLNTTKTSIGIFTYWCGAENNWKDTPVRPEGRYKFDFFAWQWVEVTQ